MKKLFTLMWAIVCAALTVVSCTPDGGTQGGDEPQGPTYTSTITVTGLPEANLAPEAGELALTYAIENESLTAGLVVTTEDTWVTVGEIGETTVPLSYAANTDAPGSPAREAVIKFAYEGAEDVLVTLKQDAAAPSFTVEFSNVTPQMAQYVCTPNDPEMLYLLATSQQLADWSVQGETPAELMANYANMLAMYGMLSGEADDWYVFKGATTEMPKEASRWSADVNVTVYAIGLSVTIGEFDPETEAPAVTINYLTPVHAWEVPFLPYPSITIAEADLTKNVTSAAGEVVIDCVVENPVEGAEVEVSTEATWVTASYADGKLTLAYEANTNAVARRATVSVGYGQYIEPIELTLVQEKDANAVAVPLNITVKETHFNKIVVDIDSSDDNAYYALNTLAQPTDWETGAPVEVDWIKEAENLISYPGTAVFLQGDQTGYEIKMNPSSYKWDGYNYYVFGFAVEMSEGKAVAQIGDVAYTLTTVDDSDMPSLAWDLEKTVGLVWNEDNERYDLEAVEGSTVVLHFTVTNQVEGASVKLNGNSLYDNYNVVDGEPVIDNAAGTITLKIDKFDTAKNYHYVNPGFKYTNEANDMWGITSPSLRITQTQGNYSKISKVEDLTAGEYYAGGYLTSYDYNGIIDWSANPYHLINGISTDLYTTPYAYTGGDLVIKEGESYLAKIVTLEAVAEKANTYYVKVGEDYLTSTEAASRKLGKTSTPAEWVASNNANGGISLMHVETGVYLGTAGATSKLCRSYTSESTLKYGLVFFKENNKE